MVIACLLLGMSACAAMAVGAVRWIASA